MACVCTEDKYSVDGTFLGNFKTGDALPEVGVIIGRNKVTCQECLDRVSAEQAAASAEAQRIADRELSRKTWENAYIAKCQSLGLSDVATTEQIKAKLEELEAAAMATGNIVGAMGAIKTGMEFLAIMNAITQNGGTWENITYHPEIN
jgi:hypothetical protein